MAYTFLVEDGSGNYTGYVEHTGLPLDTETIVINDTVKTVTFEYESTGGVTPGNIEVTIGGTSAITATNLATAITNQRVIGALDVNSSIDPNNSSKVLLHNLNVVGGTVTGSPTNTTIVSFNRSNAYATVEEADEILTQNIHTTSWFALTTADKEKLISFGSGFLDDRMNWEGSKTIETSPMRYPRTGVVDRDCHAIGNNEIPYQIKNTVAYIARYYVDQDRTIERGQDGLDSLTVDVITLDFLEGYRLAVVPTELQYMIEGLGTLRGGPNSSAVIVRA